MPTETQSCKERQGHGERCADRQPPRHSCLVLWVSWKQIRFLEHRISEECQTPVFARLLSALAEVAIAGVQAGAAASDREAGGGAALRGLTN